MNRNSCPSLGLCLTLLWLGNLPAPGLADSPAKIPVLLDTDIGADVDDSFALALVLASPELDLRGVTTVAGQAEDRAWIVCRMLTSVKRGEVPVAFGRAPQVDSKVNWKIQYRRHPSVVWNRTVKPLKVPAHEFLYQRLKAEPGKTPVQQTCPITFMKGLQDFPENIKFDI